MEPVRVMTVEPVEMGDGRCLPPWSFVWRVSSPEEPVITVEHRDRTCRIPRTAAVELPVPAPTPEQLAASLDPCFADPGRLTNEVFRDPRMFSVHRCPHGNFFLNDVRGGIVMSTHWSFLGPVDDPTPEKLVSLWEEHHALPLAAVHYLRIGR